MLDIGELYKILSTYGPSAVLLMVLIYLLLNGQIDFHYPRPEKRPKRKP